jgi:hypothetical protein
LLQRARSVNSDANIEVVVAKCEFEAWFLASAESLAGKSGLIPSFRVPKNPEEIRDAKGELTKNMVGSRSYRPTADQPALASVFDLEQARANADSFDKFWRVVEGILLAQ